MPTSKHIDLDRLRKRAQDKPRTKAGQVRQAWRDIKDPQAAGHSLKDIWAWLNEIGVEIGYANLSHCLSRLRRRERATEGQLKELFRGLVLVPQEQLQQEQPAGRGAAVQAVPSDPLRNLREQRAKKKGFEYDPFPTKGLTQ